MGSKTSIFSLILFFIFIFSCYGNKGEDQLFYSDLISRMRTYINERMDTDNVAGLSIGLVDRNGIVWTEGFGFADRKSNSPATPSTIYEIGSISKTFTATLVMELVDKNLLDIDSPLDKVLPDFSINQSFYGSGPITIRTLMTHHSGIPGDIFNNLFSTTPDPGFGDWILNYIRGEYTTFSVNYFWNYSNTAVFFMGQAAAARTGVSLNQMGNDLLLRLGMINSSFDLDNVRGHGLATPYYYNPSTKVFQALPHFYCNAQATGGIFSNVTDMALYIKMVMDHGSPVLSHTSMDEMLTQQNKDVVLDNPFSQGLNWFLYDPSLNYAGKIAWHAGDTVASHAVLMILPDLKIGVIALTNSNTGIGLVNDAARKLLQLAVEIETGLKPPEPSKPDYFPIIHKTRNELMDLEGVYALKSALGWDSIEARDGKLLWKRADQNVAVELYPRANSFFSIKDSQELQLEFIEIENRFVIRGIQGGITSVMSQRYDQSPVLPAWSGRTRKWILSNLPPTDASLHVPDELRINPAEITLRMETGMLIMDYYTEGVLHKYIMKPVDNGRAICFGLGRINGSSLRAVQFDTGEKLVFLGLEYK